MRIAQIAPPWFSVPPVGYGGIEWVVSLLADGLVERGHDVTLYASGSSVTKANLVTFFEDPPGGAHIGEQWYDVMHAAAAYRDAHTFDVVHDHSGMIGPAIGAYAGVPVVHTLHGPFVERAERFYRLISGRVSLVAISEAQRAFVPDLSYAGTVYNGVDLSRLPFREEKEDFLLFLGRINREKGPEIAVEAAKRAGRRLVLCVKKSEHHEQEYWDTHVLPRLTGDEEIIGEVTAEEKADLLSRASGVLFPIQWPEPFGLVMTEAMACGTPVVAYALGAAPEVIVDGRTGFLVNTFEDFVDRIGRLSEIAAHVCREHVASRFSAETMVAGYERVFADVLATR